MGGKRNAITVEGKDRSAVKRLGCMLACVCWFMLLLTGCGLFSQPVGPGVGPSSQPDLFPYEREYANKWCYRLLDDTLKACYADMYKAVRECELEETVTIHEGNKTTDYPGIKVKLPHILNSKEQMQLLYTSFCTDNPQFFFLGNTYSYEGYRNEGSNVEHYTTICLVFTMTMAERRTAEYHLERQISNILKDITPNMSEFDKELHLHDRLMEICRYHQEAADSKDPYTEYPDAFSAYGALVKGAAVCEGYARAMQLLCHRVGIACTLVSGYGIKNQMTHMWNLVTIDGRNYHLDPTWNDGDIGYRHVYFNVTTEEIQRTHQIDNDNIGINTCIAEEANYYRKTGLYLDTFSAEEIGKVVAQQVKTGADIIDLRFPLYKFPSAELLFNNHRRLSHYVNPHLDGGEMWQYSYQANEDYGTITLFRMKEEDDARQ